MGIDTNEHKLYIRLPIRIKDQFVIRDLHPNILQVNLPRQKSCRWCFVSFESREKLEETVIALKKVKIENKFIKFSPHNRGKKREINKKSSNSQELLLKLLKKRNPCNPEEWDDSDIEIPDNEEWGDSDNDIPDNEELITIPNTVTVDPVDPSEEEDDENDEDYNPDDENYEQEAELEDFIAYQFNCSFESFSDDDYDDEDEIDYVTYSPLPVSSSNNASPATNKTCEVTTCNQDDDRVDVD